MLTYKCFKYNDYSFDWNKYFEGRTAFPCLKAQVTYNQKKNSFALTNLSPDSKDAIKIWFISIKIN